MAQLHKKFTDKQIEQFIKRYLNKEIERKYIEKILDIKTRQFWKLVKKYKDDPENFTIKYTRKKQPRSLDENIEKNIIHELAIDQSLIEDKNIPVNSYNYSYVKERLEKNYDQKVSVNTVIDRAKKYNFYLKRRKKKSHDREVSTNYIGELIQHDSSLHLFAPAAQKKWYLITSLDDHSRYMLYARFIVKESSYSHIRGLETVFTKHGIPYCYYVDSHSIFRFVQQRDSIWRKHYTLTDQATPQWKHVLDDCNVKVSYALSPQAKGKIERPYGWLQDHIVRTCVREDITDIKEGQKVLNREVYKYNHKRVHSTTREVPSVRFQKALESNQSLFREFEIPAPFKSVKDIFCLRTKRTADGYRKVSINNIVFKVNKTNPYDTLDIRIYPLNSKVSELRFWNKHILVDIQKIKNSDLKGVHF